MTSGAKSERRFGKDLIYLPTEDVYRCPAGEKLTYPFTREEAGKTSPPLLDDGLPALPTQSAMHTGSAAPHHALGTRICARRCAAPSRCEPAGNARAP
jgi:hypothetical protein